MPAKPVQRKNSATLTSDRPTVIEQTENKKRQTQKKRGNRRVKATPQKNNQTMRR